MKELSFDEAKTIELDILLHISDFCKKNNLHYFLAYGTLIGAVRHKGFIPWDDDIDINMPRQDYNWLIENYNKINPNGRYQLISPYSKEARHSFVKIIDTYTVKIEEGIDYNDRYLGVDIDIFPLDGQPNSDEKFNRWYNKLMRVYRIYFYCKIDQSTSFKKRTAIPLLRLLYNGGRNALKKAEKLHKKYPYEKSKYIGAVECMFNSRGNRYQKEWFDHAIEAEFEGHLLWIPCGYNQILTQVYGDYMKLPPKEKQVSHHKNKMYLITEEKEDEII